MSANKPFCKSLLIIPLIMMFGIPDLISADNKAIKYPVNEIPEELKSNAMAVIRNEEKKLKISSPDYAEMETSFAITILNENALQYTIFIEFYSTFDRIFNISGKVYNALGEKVEQMQFDEVIDHSAISFSSLYDDNRVKYYEPHYRTYPYTVEYSFTTYYYGFLSFPEWFPGRTNNISVQRSVFDVKADNSVSFRYFNRNTDIKPEIIHNKNNTTYTWVMENQPALAEQPWCQSVMDYLPGILFSPNEFSFDGYTGNYSSWYSFGQWIKEINKDRDQLSYESRVFLNEMVRDCDSDYAKAKMLYEYMQKKTRYVSIQVGIGGWQPFKAEDVNRLGYGDCKALANYLKALFYAVGIQSYYTLVRAGENAPSIIREFPSQQFNHAILCLPLDTDTLWIECTNPHLPFAYIGTFTDDRDVLLIDNDGGKLVHTKTYSISENSRTVKVSLTIDSNGNAEMIVRRKFAGSFFDDKLQTYLSDYEQQKKILYEEMNLPGMSIDSFRFTRGEATIPWIEQSLGVSVPNYCSQAGSRMLVQLNRLPALQVIPKKVGSRKADVIIKRSFTAVDTIEYILPENYQPESLPSPKDQVSVFGQCEYTCFQKNERVIYVRKFHIKKGTYPPSAYDSLVDFLKNTTLQDMAKMSLIRKPG